MILKTKLLMKNNNYDITKTLEVVCVGLIRITLILFSLFSLLVSRKYTVNMQGAGFRCPLLLGMWSKNGSLPI
jgi:hypothetical protein